MGALHFVQGTVGILLMHEAQCSVQGIMGMPDQPQKRLPTRIGIGYIYVHVNELLCQVRSLPLIWDTTQATDCALGHPFLE